MLQEYSKFSNSALLISSALEIGTNRQSEYSGTRNTAEYFGSGANLKSWLCGANGQR